MRVDAYEILDKVRIKHGIPFEKGQPLPEEYEDYFPIHKYHDGIIRGVERKAEKAAYSAGAEATTAFLSSDGSHGDGDHDAGNQSPFESDDSKESVPEQFRPRQSEGSEDSLENASHGDSDEGNDWEMHPGTEDDDEDSSSEEGSEE